VRMQFLDFNLETTRLNILNAVCNQPAILDNGHAVCQKLQSGAATLNSAVSVVLLCSTAEEKHEHKHTPHSKPTKFYRENNEIQQ